MIGIGHTEETGHDGQERDRLQCVRHQRQDVYFAETDRFVKKVRWSMGDIIIWDNRFLAHTSGRNGGPEEETMMYRLTLYASQMVPESVAA